MSKYDDWSGYVSREDVSLSPTGEHHTVGKEFMGPRWDLKGVNATRWFCYSHDQAGYWMYATDGTGVWHNVSERAIGRSFHEIWRDGERLHCSGWNIVPYSKQSETWFKPFRDELVGWVVKTRHDKFIPFLGKCHVGEDWASDDAFIEVIGKQPPQDTPETALAFFEPDKDKIKRIFRKPLSSSQSGGIMGNWLVVMVINEDGVDPRTGAKVNYGAAAHDVP